MTANNTPEKNIAVISTLDEHRALISEVFATAKKRILIASPNISTYALESDDIPNKIKKAVSRDVDVHIHVNKKYMNDADGVIKSSSKEAIVALLRAGARVFWSNDISSKILAKDDDLIAEGSFNWLSASRSNKSNKGGRRERTLLIKGENAEPIIDGFIKNAEQNNEEKKLVVSQKEKPKEEKTFFISP